MKNKKRTILLSGMLITTLIILGVGATFAYFRATSNNGSNTDINVTTYTFDLLTFEIGNDITIYADQSSFAKDKGNATGNTFAKAILTANNKTNEATKNYYMYLNITSNEFTYTQDGNTPELLLTITDASGTPIKDITTLTYKTVTDGKNASISGYDITNKEGLITLFDNKEITASPTKTDEWNITITFINYNKDQSKNMGKSFSSKLIITKEKQSDALSIDTACYQNENLAECIKSTSYRNKKLVHHDDSNVLIKTFGANDDSYRFVGFDGTACDVDGVEAFFSASNLYNIEACQKIYKLSNLEIVNYFSVLYGWSYSSEYVYTDFPVTSLQKQAVKWNSETQRCETTDGIRVLTNAGFNKNTTEQLECSGDAYYFPFDDGGYWYVESPQYVGEGRYWGNTNNYVCFGSDASTCPENNLYRIIGVFDNKIKLIKAKPLTDKYSFDLDNINKVFLDNLDSKWSNLIAENSWNISTRVASEIKDDLYPFQIYQKEILSEPSTYYKSKIGLLYLSDYLFSENTNRYFEKSNDKNRYYTYSWMKDIGTDGNSLVEKFSPLMMNSDKGRFALSFFDLGYAYIPRTDVTEYNINPVFYLNTSVKYISGNGTSSNPIRILT